MFGQIAFADKIVVLQSQQCWKCNLSRRMQAVKHLLLCWPAIQRNVRIFFVEIRKFEYCKCYANRSVDLTVRVMQIMVGFASKSHSSKPYEK